jgi:hypothetical protein
LECGNGWNYLHCISSLLVQAADGTVVAGAAEAPPDPDKILHMWVGR